MSDERRHLTIAVVTLLSMSVLFAGMVVLVTRSDLDLTGQDPLSRHTSDESDCYDMVRAASDAVQSARALDARRHLAAAESLACGNEVICRMAQLYRRMGDSPAAVRLLQSYAPRDRTPEVLTELAGALFDIGAIDSARAAFRCAVLLPGATPPTVRSLAWMALSLEEAQRAETLFTRAVSLFPNDPELWRARSTISLQLGEVTQAIESALRAVGLAPSSCGAQIALGWASEARGDTAAALQAFTTAASLCPSDSLVLFEVGRFHYRGRRDATALPYLVAATHAASCPLEWLLMRAHAEQGAHRIDQARGTLRLACQRFAGDYRPFLELAKLERWHGDTNQARVLADKANRLAPDEPRVIRFVELLG